LRTTTALGAKKALAKARRRASLKDARMRKEGREKGGCSYGEKVIVARKTGKQERGKTREEGETLRVLGGPKDKRICT